MLTLRSDFAMELFVFCPDCLPYTTSVSRSCPNMLHLNVTQTGPGYSIVGVSILQDFQLMELIITHCHIKYYQMKIKSRH